MTSLTTTKRRAVAPQQLTEAAKAKLLAAEHVLLEAALELPEGTAEAMAATNLAHGLIDFRELMQGR